MNLYKYNQNPAVVAPEDDTDFQIKEVEGELILKRQLVEIFDNSGNSIGEYTGYSLNIEEINNNLDYSLDVMDSISMLLCSAYELIVHTISDSHKYKRALFINRLTIYEEFYNKEVEKYILSNLGDSFDLIIYSLGKTELTDKAFFEHQDDKYFAQSKELLKELKWSYNSELELYYKSNDR